MGSSPTSRPTTKSHGRLNARISTNSYSFANICRGRRDFRIRNRRTGKWTGYLIAGFSLDCSSLLMRGNVLGVPAPTFIFKTECLGNCVRYGIAIDRRGSCCLQPITLNARTVGVTNLDVTVERLHFQPVKSLLDALQTSAQSAARALKKSLSECWKATGPMALEKPFRLFVKSLWRNSVRSRIETGYPKPRRSARINSDAQTLGLADRPARSRWDGEGCRARRNIQPSRLPGSRASKR